MHWRTGSFAVPPSGFEWFVTQETVVKLTANPEEN